MGVGGDSNELWKRVEKSKSPHAKTGVWATRLAGDQGTVELNNPARRRILFPQGPFQGRAPG